MNNYSVSHPQTVTPRCIQLSGGYTCLACSSSLQCREGRGQAGGPQAAPRLCAESAPGRHYTAVGPGGRRREFRRGSRRRTSRGGGQPATKRALFFFPPPGAGTNGLAAAEVISQAKPGVRLRMGPQGQEPPLGPRVGRSQLEHPGRWLLVLGLSFRSVQLVKSSPSWPPLGLPVGLEI